MNPLRWIRGLWRVRISPHICVACARTRTHVSRRNYQAWATSQRGARTHFRCRCGGVLIQPNTRHPAYLAAFYEEAGES